MFTAIVGNALRTSRSNSELRDTVWILFTRDSKFDQNRRKPQWLLLGTFVQKIFATNLNFRYQTSKKSEKVKPLLLCQF